MRVAPFICALIRREHRHARANNGPGTEMPGAEASLVALEQNPGDARSATELARVLLARADLDRDFQHDLAAWWELARQVQVSSNVSNSVSGGIQYGPVLQGRDFTDLKFGSQTGQASDK